MAEKVRKEQYGSVPVTAVFSYGQRGAPEASPGKNNSDIVILELLLQFCTFMATVRSIFLKEARYMGNYVNRENADDLLWKRL